MVPILISVERQSMQLLASYDRYRYRLHGMSGCWDRIDEYKGEGEYPFLITIYSYLFTPFHDQRLRYFQMFDHSHSPANTVRNMTFVKVPFSSFMDERNEDVLKTYS